MAKKNKNKQVKANTPPPAPVVNSLVIRAPNRRTSDVAYWRRSLQSADMGRIKQLFDLYDDLLIDGTLGDAQGKRVEAVTNAELVFTDAQGESVPEIADLMNTLDWEVLLKEICNTQFWGRSGVEFDFTEGFHVTPIPKSHISLETGTILVNDTDQSGIPYAGDDHLLILGTKGNWGLFLRTAPYVIWKRGGFGDWAQWSEIFGMPQRIGKYNTYDPQSRILLEEALEKAGSAPWCVVPEGTDVETVNNTGSGSSGVSYNDFRKACNEEMLITILGQTLTTIQGERGARSLGEIHKLVEEGKNKADMRFTEKVLNTFVRPILERRGYPVQGGHFVFPAAVADLSVEDIVSLSDILPIPQSFLYDKFGIPTPKKGELIARKQTTEVIDVEKVEEKEDTGKKTGKKEETKEEIKNDDRSFVLKLFDRMMDFFAVAPTMWSGARKDFAKRLKDSITGTITLADDYSLDINRLVNEAIREIYGSRGEELVNKHLFDITNTPLQYAVDTSLKPVENTDPGFVQRFRESTAVFSAFKNHQQTEEIAALLYDEKGNLKPFYKFRKEALNVSKDYNINWLQTEYNTAVRSARMAANMLKYKEASHLYPNLEYVHTTSAHPREKHLRYVGTILPIGHPWWDGHLPPSDWNCACSVRQTDKPETPVPDGEYVDPVFRNNPSKTAEFVNIPETAYYKHTEKSKRKEVAETGIRLLRVSGNEKKEVYKGKKGGFLEIVTQNKNEREKNLTTYKYLADRGSKYTLLQESEQKGVKNPDAFNHETGYFSDAKHPVSGKGKNVIQTSIKAASGQKVEELIIRLDKDYPAAELYEGLKASLQKGRASELKEIILIRKGRNPLHLDVEKVRARFTKNK